MPDDGIVLNMTILCKASPWITLKSGSGFAIGVFIVTRLYFALVSLSLFRNKRIDRRISKIGTAS